MLRRSILSAMALGVAAPALAMQSAAPLGLGLGPATPQTAPASSSPTFIPPSSPPPTSQFIRNPIWERLPTAAELAPLYPNEARTRGQVGKTKMKCEVLKDGALTACTILQEDPPGQGFGESILASARYFKMAPTAADGTSVEGRSIIIPIKWEVAPPPPTSAKP
jgi:TonB family protein